MQYKSSSNIHAIFLLDSSSKALYVLVPDTTDMGIGFNINNREGSKNIKYLFAIVAG